MFDKLHSLIYTNLMLQTPVLSGNMQRHINVGQIGSAYGEIIIDAPFYDMKAFKKTGAVVHTGKSVKGKTAYAEWVNKSGAFGRHNKSEHWVNRTLYECCLAVANEVGGIVINELPL